MRESILQIVKYSENRKRYDCNVIPFFMHIICFYDTRLTEKRSANYKIGEKQEFLLKSML